MSKRRFESLSYDAILLALTVAASGCSKGERLAPAVAEPNPMAASATQTATAVPTSAAPAPTAASAAAVDAATEIKRAGPKTGHAACGASGCSPDMKKGNQ